MGSALVVLAGIGLLASDHPAATARSGALLSDTPLDQRGGGGRHLDDQHQTRRVPHHPIADAARLDVVRTRTTRPQHD